MEKTSLNSLKNFLKTALGMNIKEDASETEVIDAMEQYDAKVDGYLSIKDFNAAIEALEGKITANGDAIGASLSEDDVVGLIDAAAYDDSAIKENLKKVGEKILSMEGSGQSTDGTPSTPSADALIDAAKSGLDAFEAKNKTKY